MNQQTPPPMLVAVGGLSGSGKTSLAGALRAFIPNSVHLDSDLVRKEVFGVAATTRLPPSCYSAEATVRLVAEMEKRVKAALAEKKNVIVSAAFLTPESRLAEEKLAAVLGARFEGIWLKADLAVLFDRVTARKDDASDATAEIVKSQANEDVGNVTWMTIDANQAKEAILMAAIRALRSEKGSSIIKLIKASAAQADG